MHAAVSCCHCLMGKRTWDWLRRDCVIQRDTARARGEGRHTECNYAISFLNRKQLNFKAWFCVCCVLGLWGY